MSGESEIEMILNTRKNCWSRLDVGEMKLIYVSRDSLSVHFDW